MTDAIPAQPSADTAADAEAGTPDANNRQGYGTLVVDRANVALSTAGDAISGAASTAGDAISGAASRAGEVFHDAAGKAQVAIGGAADKAGDALREGTEKTITRIRNNATLAAERGTTTIANEVVEKIAGIAAREVPGVYDLGGDTARVMSALRERLHLGEESSAQGVNVKLEGREADLHITLVLEFGFVVSTVCDKVREKAISSVENLLGLDVTNVDILVDDIHVDNDGPVGDDAARAVGYSSETTGITVG